MMLPPLLVLVAGGPALSGLKPCKVSGDCPCGEDQLPTGECFGGYCVECRNLGQTCDDVTQRCCSTGESCVDESCCRRTSQPCSASDDCCGSDVCLSGRCLACRKLSQTCSEDADCCDGQCRSGICQVPCEEGTSCQVSGKQGLCSEGVTRCTPTAVVCEQVQFPTSELCDQQDNDCNGEVDDIPPTPCTGSPRGCQSGFQSPGFLRCDHGEEVCDMTRCAGRAGACDYCAICTDGPPCGSCKSCKDDCPPNKICRIVNADYAPSECFPNPRCTNLKTPTCWLPEQMGACVP